MPNPTQYSILVGRFAVPWRLWEGQRKGVRRVAHPLSRRAESRPDAAYCAGSMKSWATQPLVPSLVTTSHQT